MVERLREDISDNGIKTHVGDPLLEKLDTELKGPIDAVSKLSKGIVKCTSLRLPI